MKSYSNGDKMREALETLRAGETILYRGVVHTVIDAEQGMRIACVKTLGHSDGEPYDTRIEDR